MAEAKEKTYTVHDVKDRLKVTVPKVLVQAVGIGKEDIFIISLPHLGSHLYSR